MSQMHSPYAWTPEGSRSHEPYVDVAHRFPARAGTPSAARRLVSTLAFDHVAPDVLLDAKLLVSELATNAILHAGGLVAVRVNINGVLRVEVGDADPRPLPPPELPADPLALGKRGLVLVDEISDAWGCDVAPHGKRVWFELARFR